MKIIIGNVSQVLEVLENDEDYSNEVELLFDTLEILKGVRRG